MTNVLVFGELMLDGRARATPTELLLLLFVWYRCAAWAIYSGRIVVVVGGELS